MEKVVMLLVCCVLLYVQCEVMLEADRPSLKVELSHEAVLECCFTAKGPQDVIWVRKFLRLNKPSVTKAFPSTDNKLKDLTMGKYCGIFTLKSTTLNDTGFYQCYLNSSKLFTHGTYLQVYKPLEKTINLSEGVKNGILTAEGILLLICVMLPSASLLFKSKNLHDLEKKKVRKEEENIYQGLNLDDCCPEYDEIERLRGHGPYEDVGNNQEDIQLEKP